MGGTLVGESSMPAFRSVVSMLLRELGDFSLHPQGRPCGRPPAALRPGDDPAEPGNRPHAHARWYCPLAETSEPANTSRMRSKWADCIAQTLLKRCLYAKMLPFGGGQRDGP